MRPQSGRAARRSPSAPWVRRDRCCSKKREDAPEAPRDESGAIAVRAQAKFVRSAPRKARLVMDHIRGKDVADARAILQHTSRAVASDISKLLESAVANAENNFELDPDDLKIGRAVSTRARRSSATARAPRAARRGSTSAPAT